MQWTHCKANVLSVLIQDKRRRIPEWFNLNQRGSSYEKCSYYSIQSPAFPVLELSPCEKAHTCCSEVLCLSRGQAESRAELPTHVLWPASVLHVVPDSGGEQGIHSHGCSKSNLDPSRGDCK